MDWVALAAPCLAFAATWKLAGKVRAWLARRAILDRPVERSSHRVPVPRGGGLAVVPVVLAAWLGLAAVGRAPAGAAPIAVLAALLGVLSWRDDIRSLPVGLRLLGHLAAAALGLAFLPDAGRVFQGLLPPFLDDLAAILLWVWFVNLFNFMDGIDGIAGTETAAIGVGLAAVTFFAGQSLTSAAVLGLVLAAGAAGFLRWNWHPARLFLGDVGSVPLGYLLGWLLLGLAGQGLWAPALILPLYYLADASWTLAWRALRGERFWEPHRRHFYQRALAPDGDHAAVTTLIAAVDGLLILLALAALARPVLAVALAGAVVAGLLGLLEARARRNVAASSDRAP